MGKKKIESLERELGLSWTENLSINTGSDNPHYDDVLGMVEDRNLSLSLRRELRMN
jgi:hypothetical protein